MTNRKAIIDDNIMLKGQLSTAGSQMLYNFISPLDACLTDKLNEAGVSFEVRPMKNEFGIGLSGAFPAVSAVADGEVEIGFSCDALGIPRRQAALSGCGFVKPSYGSVSRFGLISTAPSMEQIGVAFRKLSDGFSALSAVAGKDDRDGVMAMTEKYFYHAGEEGLGGMKVAMLAGTDVPGLKEELSALGAAVETVELPLIKYVPQVSYIIACAETSNSISRFDGIKFGYRSENFNGLDELYVKSRTEGFTLETKVLILMGMLVLSKEKYEAYFEQALKVRRMIKDQTDALWNQYDCLILPVKTEDSAYRDLAFTALSNLTGSPAMVLPGFGGYQCMAKCFDENTLYRFGAALEGKGEVAK